ncbi:hypothetical protein AYO44_05320 [Planctomycetaceae bacterium SCGC AG-212-F19]|nr:hypothetical protein AYO44_05320 [Planctomycetaceae bacterium SCGC AG-212-F19]
MGKWAVDGWRGEFGPHRTYFNIPYFSDLERFAKPNPCPGKSRRFLFSGMLIKRKGVDLLAEAFARLAAEYPHVSLDLLGNGDLEPALRRILKRCASQVRFLGFHSWKELPGMYHAADILCVPSRYDGWGLVVPEGLAAGLPVIATHATGAALDLIQPGENGWLIASGDSDALYQALHEAATLPEAELQRRAHVACASAATHSLAVGVRRWTDAARATLAQWAYNRLPQQPTS